ncbi:MAG: 30S ribosome-binding factor RbfA [Bacillota bacterium]|nr:30S ribosome-binding factor RbfA [Bacillota bacterium]
MGKGYRQSRIGEEIRKIISDMLFSGLKDPRLNPMVSITAVEVSGDNSYATVYFSSMEISNNEEEARKQQEEVLEGFEKAKGYIRREIGKKMKLRHTPELVFKIDHSMEHSRHIESILGTIDLK